MNSSIFRLQSVLIYILPFALITGPFISDLICIIISILFFIYIFKYKHFYILNNIWIKLFFLWCVYLIFSSLISKNIYLSLESSLFYFRFGIFAIAISLLIDKNKNLTKNFFFSLLGAFILISIDGYFQFITGKNILEYSYDGQRLSSFFGDEKIMGSYLSRLFPLLFALLILNFSNSRNWMLFGVLVLVSSDVLIYLSGERTAFFNLILVTVLIIFLIKKWRYVRILSLVISLIILLTISLNNTSVQDRMINQTMVQTGISEGELKAFSSVHQIHYKSAFLIFKDYPLFGVGPKNFRFVCSDEKYLLYESQYNENSCSTHPHNTYMQLLAETGLLGTLPVFFIFIFIIYQFLRKFYSNIFLKKEFVDDYQVCLYICIFITLWPLIPSGSFFNNYINIIYYLPLGFLLNTFKLTNKNINQ